MTDELNYNGAGSEPVLRVAFRVGSVPCQYEFNGKFILGRAEDCDVLLDDSHVSRHHLGVTPEAGLWKVRDLNSSNGMFVGDRRETAIVVSSAATVRLGIGGPFVSFEVVGQPGEPIPTLSAAPPVRQTPPVEPPRATASVSPLPVAAPVTPLAAMTPPAPPPAMMAPTPSLAAPASLPSPPPAIAQVAQAEPLPPAAPATPVQPDPPRASHCGESVEAYAKYYFDNDKDDTNAGDHTRMVRTAFAQVQKKQRSKWLLAVGALAVVVLAVSGYAVYEHRKVAEQRALAENIFYSMKGLDVDISNFERVMLDTNHPGVIEELKKYRNRRRDIEKQYDEFLTNLKVVDAKLPVQRRLTLRVARIFGECELAMPPDFETEIQRYISMWRSSGRYANAIAAAKANGYDRVIAHELLDAGLPPQFFYLALQESGFDPWISGPETYSGIAKGMWQFIPETAVKYGLRIGPLVDLRRPDPADQRNDWQLATKAAARYMKDLYGTDAQASGLLVMASYNWGEKKVLPLIRSLPANPRDRNFWKLLAKYRDKLPKETYDYVFYITAAAVIGEDPRAFGFDMDNPLAHLGT